MITFESRGDFSNLTSWLEKLKKPFKLDILNKYGKLGVEALARNTPVDTGETASSWEYSISEDHGSYELSFNNTNENKGVKIAILLQYGHGTGTGGWVDGRDYINPAVQPIFDALAEDAWKEITEL